MYNVRERPHIRHGNFVQTLWLTFAGLAIVILAGLFTRTEQLHGGSHILEFSARDYYDR